MIYTYVSHACSLITTPTRSPQLPPELYYHRDTPNSLEHLRKGRLCLQKAHDHQKSANGNVCAQSTLQNKGAKFEEILAKVERRRGTRLTTTTEDAQSHENIDSEGAESVLTDDMELYHADGVVI